MKWHNLKNNKCPKCNKDCAITQPFNFVPATQMLEHKCGFKISMQRYKEIVSGMVSVDLLPDITKRA